MWNAETRRIGERLLRGASDLERLDASVSAVKEQARRDGVASDLDVAAAALELARTAFQRAQKKAATAEGREAYAEILEKLAEISNDRRADRSSGLMCSVYEAEVRS